MSSLGWRDDPISEAGSDTLGRAGYAATLARTIVGTHSWNGGTVFGLTGPWGSGKTSLLRLITKELVAVDGDYEVVWFTPWAAHDVNGVLADFYTALLSALPKSASKKARKSFATLLRIAAPAGGLLPIGGDVATSAISATAEALNRNKPWDSAFREASDQILKGRRKILVVVDDIDRLQGDELLTVLKLIRLLGRFPGVQYLLAYDHDSLAHTLEAVGAVKDRVEASRYVEKIVQYPLPVPAMVGVQLIQRLTTGLHDLIEQQRPDLPERRLRRTSELLPLMCRTLTTPRAIDRYFAQLHYELAFHLSEEADDEDLIALVLLRTVAPTVFARLPRYEYELVNGEKRRLIGMSAASPEIFTVEDLIAGLELTPQEAYAASEILRALFPNLNPHGMTRRRGVGDGSYFRRYFAMGILSDHDIPDGEVRVALQSGFVGNGQALTALLLTDNYALAQLTLVKLQESFLAEFQQVSASGGDAAALALLRILVPVMEAFPDPATSDLAVSEQLARWIGKDLLPSMSDTMSADELTDVFLQATNRHRLLILQAARNRISEAPTWWNPLIDASLPAVQAEFLDHLSERDDAPITREDLIDFFVHAAHAGVDLKPVRDSIANAIDDGTFTIADLAARFVSRDGTGSSYSHRQAEFDLIAPRQHYSWYDETEPLPSGDDWRWQTRRAVASRLLTEPA